MRYIQALIEVPNDVSVEEAKEYVRSELRSAGGCRHPDDPLFGGLNVSTLKSVSLRNVKGRVAKGVRG